jgi:NodT family efflux transporter outer membrane factor (OMF) lipoprotein
MTAALPVRLLLVTTLLLSACGGSANLFPPLGSSAQFRHAVPEQPRTPGITTWWQACADPQLLHLLQRTASANAEVHIAVQRLQQARQGVIAMAAPLWPSLDLNGSQSHTRSALPNAIKQGGMPDLEAKRLALSAQWELDLFGGQHAAHQAAQQEAAAALYGVAGAQLLAISESARHYLRWQALQERITLLQQLLANQDAYRQRLYSQLREGWISTRETAMADAEWANLAATLPTLRSQAMLSEHRIALLSGDDPSQPVPELHPDGASALHHLPEPSPGQPAELLQRRPDLLAAERQLAAASAHWQEARAQLFPKIFLSALFGRQTLFLNHAVAPPTAPYSAVAATFTLPLLHAGALQANVEAHSAQEKELWLHYENRLHQAIEEVENLLQARQEEQKSQALLHSTLQARQTVLQRANALLEQGQIGLLPYLEAERAVLLAAMRVNESQMQHALLTVQLFTALGGGWQHLPPPEGLPTAQEE